MQIYPTNDSVKMITAYRPMLNLGCLYLQKYANRVNGVIKFIEKIIITIQICTTGALSMHLCIQQTPDFLSYSGCRPMSILIACISLTVFKLQSPNLKWNINQFVNMFSCGLVCLYRMCVSTSVGPVPLMTQNWTHIQW